MAKKPEKHNPLLAKFQEAVKKAGHEDLARRTPKPADAPRKPTKKVAKPHTPAAPAAPVEKIGTLLIVEPNERVAKMLANQLGSLHMDPSVTDTGMDAIMLVQVEKVRLIILSETLKDMSGASCCSRIRAQEQGRDVPILMATDRMDENSRMNAEMVGADDIVARPYNLPELLEKARALLKKASQG